MIKAFHEQRLFPKDLPLLLIKGNGIDYLAHWQNEVELLFVSKGSQTLGIHHQLTTLMAGQAAFISPGDIHYYHREQPGRIHRQANEINERASDESYMLFFPPDLVLPMQTSQSFIWQPLDMDIREKILSTILQLKNVLDKQEPYFELHGRGLLQILLAELFRQEPSSLAGHMLKSQTGCEAQMPQILSYLSTQFSRSLSRDQVARQFGFSPAHFSRVFKKTTGLPFSLYLRQLRTQKANDMLRHSTLSVTEIALSCGFESIRTFNRVFRELTGIHPTSLRPHE